ncbi:MAG: hypothetical protein R3D55_07875 [Chloroflexota bacterium]
MGKITKYRQIWGIFANFLVAFAYWAVTAFALTGANLNYRFERAVRGNQRREFSLSFSGQSGQMGYNNGMLSYDNKMRAVMGNGRTVQGSVVGNNQGSLA